jgi:hypothetical protein
MNLSKKELKRRSNILYRLRKKGVRVLTEDRTIFYPGGCNPYSVLQVRQLTSEYKFKVQFEISKSYENY